MTKTVATPSPWLKPKFFATPAAFRRWFERHQEGAAELWVGFHKRATGKPSITWPQSVDVALCFGWIDGIRRSIDGAAYAIRFTPRRSRSIWSKINMRRVAEMTVQGLMHPAGLRAYEARDKADHDPYGLERRRTAKFDPAQLRRFRANKRAWSWFAARPPSYRRVATWWVISAKKEETRERRLAQLIDYSAQGRTVPPLTPPGTKEKQP